MQVPNSALGILERYSNIELLPNTHNNENSALKKNKCICFCSSLCLEDVYWLCRNTAASCKWCMKWKTPGQPLRGEIADRPFQSLWNCVICCNLEKTVLKKATKLAHVHTCPKQTTWTEHLKHSSTAQKPNAVSAFRIILLSMELLPWLKPELSCPPSVAYVSSLQRFDRSDHCELHCTSVCMVTPTCITLHLCPKENWNHGHRQGWCCEHPGGVSHFLLSLFQTFSSLQLQKVEG